MYICLGIFFFICYLLSLLFFLIGLSKIPAKQNIIYNNSNDISIILCVRNGADSLNFILNDFKKQQYSANLEFIIVDDDSNDETKSIIDSFVQIDNRFKYFNTKNVSSLLNHKKKALELGISKASYEWLLFTDVDCRVNEKWALSMSSYFPNSDYIIGYSNVKSNNSLISKFQNIDFRMLMLSACSSTFMNYPLACTGQNQSYKKNVYDNIHGYSKIAGLLQGDDSIFLQLCMINKNLKVVFPLDKNSHVIAKTHRSWKDFILQRIRWSGDANIMWKYNKIFYLIILSTFIANLFILILLYMFQYKLLVQLLLFKFIFEYLLYMIGSKKIKVDTNQISFVFWFFIQIPYIVFMGLSSFFVNTLSWRGR
tara:strand:+ start:1787 stop:2890 length:1104 start_codon:yes stop_codon:yes gene_type:complete